MILYCGTVLYSTLYTVRWAFGGVRAPWWLVGWLGSELCVGPFSGSRWGGVGAVRPRALGSSADSLTFGSSLRVSTLVPSCSLLSAAPRPVRPVSVRTRSGCPPPVSSDSRIGTYMVPRPAAYLPVTRVSLQERPPRESLGGSGRPSASPAL